MTLECFRDLLLAHRGHWTVDPNNHFKETARIGRRVDQWYAPRLVSGTLPSVRQISRHEGARSSTTDSDLIANHEDNFAAQDVVDLVAVMVDMQEDRALGWCCWRELNFRPPPCQGSDSLSKPHKSVT